MIVYLAHPIDNTDGGVLDALIDTTKEVLGSQGHVVFDPATAWSVPRGTEPTPALQKANHRTLGLCDAVVAVMAHGIASVGVIVEVVEATQTGVPVVVMSDLRPSWALAALDVPMVEQISQVVTWLDERSA